MTENQKVFIDNYVKNKKGNDEEFNLVLQKLTEFLSPFFEDISTKNNNSIFFNLKLFGDYCIDTNLDYSEPINLLIQTYYTNKNDLNFSLKREQKGEIGKLLTDSFNISNNILPTNQELLNLLYKFIVLKGMNYKVYLRKNCIYLKFLDYTFCLFFITNNHNNSFVLKGKQYDFNIDLLNQNLIEKDKKTKGKFFKLIKFYKIIEKELAIIEKPYYYASLNIYLYENLLYNLPDDTFKNKHVYDNFIESYNFLQNAYKTKTLNDFINAEKKPLINDNYKLYEKPCITTKDIKLVLKNCKIFINNIDNILKIN